MILEFIARISGGTIKPPAYLSAFLRAHDGKDVKIKLSENTKRISNKQHGYWRGVVIPAAVELFRENGTSITPEKVHEHLKQHVVMITEDIVLPDGTIQTQIKSSADWTTKEACEAGEKARAWAAEYGKMIPLPKEFVSNGQRGHNYFGTREPGRNR